MKLSFRASAFALVGAATASLVIAAGYPVTPAAPTQSQNVAVGVQADQRLPQDTYVYLSIPSVDLMKQRLQKSFGWKMFSDPAFAEFKGEIEKVVGGSFEQANSQLQSELGLAVQDILDIPSGQVSLAVSAVEGKLGFIAFLDFGKSRKAIDALLDKMTEGLERQGIKKVTGDYEGTELVVYALPGQENNPVVRELQYCIKDNEFVISTSMPLLKTVLANWGGSDDSFSANKNWAYIADRCKTGNKHAMMNWYLDPIGIFNTVAASGDFPELATAGAFMPMLGLNSFQAMGGMIDASVGKYDSLSRSMFICDEATGLLKVFALKEGDLRPPAWIPASVSVYSATNWNVADAFSAIETLADSMGGAGALSQQIDQIAQQTSIHIKNDIVDQLTGVIQVIGDSPADGEAAAASVESLFSGKMAFALGCKNEKAMSALVGKLTDAPNFPGEVREFRDASIVEIPNPGGGPSLGLTVARKSLVLATDVTLLETIIRGDADDTLAGSTDYQRVAAEFPNKTMSISFTNQKKQLKSMYDGLRSGDTLDMFPGMGETLENIDFSKLPEFSAIAKYFLPAGGYMISDERGAFSQSFSLAP